MVRELNKQITPEEYAAASQELARNVYKYFGAMDRKAGDINAGVWRIKQKEAVLHGENLLEFVGRNLPPFFEGKTDPEIEDHQFYVIAAEGGLSIQLLDISALSLKVAETQFPIASHFQPQALDVVGIDKKLSPEDVYVLLDNLDASLNPRTA